MNFIETLKSAELVLATGEVPLVIGESGIGKTALAKELAQRHKWHLVVIDGNLLKEGEIGGLPTIETYKSYANNGEYLEKKMTVYAVHHKLREMDQQIEQGKEVLLFIDEINRCEHTVQQELMNLILNREINGYRLPPEVKILAAMNPSNKYGMDFDYQVVEMDAAQEDRFVWLYMESDAMQWLTWAMASGIDEKIIDFISTFPEYLNKKNEEDVSATPRSFERVSKSYKLYKEQKDEVPRTIFLNVLRGNVGRVIAEELMGFIEVQQARLMSYEELFEPETMSEALVEKIKGETHTRLYLATINSLRRLERSLEMDGEKQINRLIEILELYPVDLMVGMMKAIKKDYPTIYEKAIENEAFVAAYFNAYGMMRG